MRPVFFVLALAVLSAGPLALADVPPMEHRTFDISDLVTAARARPPVRLGIGSSADNNVPEPEVPEPAPWASADQIVDLLQRLSPNPEVWNTDYTSLSVQGHMLQVLARPEVVAQTAKLLEQFAAVANRRARLHVAVRDGDGADAPVLAAGSIEAPFGSTRSIEVTNRVRFVADYDVEIAQASNISDPIVRSGLEGLVADLAAEPSQDGKTLLVDGLLQYGKFGDVRRVDQGVDEECFNRPFRSDRRYGLGTLELPAFDHAESHFTADLAPGKTLRLPLVSGGRHLVFEVTGEATGAGPSDTFLDVGGFTREAMPVYFGLPAEADNRDMLAPRVRWFDEQPAPLGTADEVIDLIHSHVDPAQWENSDQNDIENVTERTVVLRAGATLRPQVLSFLQQEEAAMLGPVGLDVRVLSVGPGTGQAAGAGGAPHPPQGTVVASGRLWTLPGRLASAMIGRTANYIADYDVEVAQEARIADPIIGQAFGGLVVNATPHPFVAGGGLEVELLMLVSHMTIASQPYESGTQYLGPIDKVDARRAVIDTTLRIPDGQSARIDLGPDPEHSDHMLEVEVRRAP